MRRADRLFLLIHALRGRRRAVTAQQLATILGISSRTVYRDVVDLQLSGVPIEGEAGVGYVLRKGADIPPLMFNGDELEALVVGTRFVGAFGGTRMASAARAALLKIEAVLPPELQQRADRSRIFAPAMPDRLAANAIIDHLHEAVIEHRVLGLDYADTSGTATSRDIEPLCLAFWGGVWTVGAWCRMRQGFRNFRTDRIVAFARTGEIFEETPEHGLAAYLRAVS
jgi:predicted DNA-binding transcriptional regulator YafY